MICYCRAIIKGDTCYCQVKLHYLCNCKVSEYVVRTVIIYLTASKLKFNV